MQWKKQVQGLGSVSTDNCSERYKSLAVLRRACSHTHIIQRCAKAGRTAIGREMAWWCDCIPVAVVSIVLKWSNCGCQRTVQHQGALEHFPAHRKRISDHTMGLSTLPLLSFSRSSKANTALLFSHQLSLPARTHWTTHVWCYLANKVNIRQSQTHQTTVQVSGRKRFLKAKKTVGKGNRGQCSMSKR